MRFINWIKNKWFYFTRSKQLTQLEKEIVAEKAKILTEPLTGLQAVNELKKLKDKL